MAERDDEQRPGKSPETRKDMEPGAGAGDPTGPEGTSPAQNTPPIDMGGESGQTTSPVPEDAEETIPDDEPRRTE